MQESTNFQISYSIYKTFFQASLSIGSLAFVEVTEHRGQSTFLREENSLFRAVTQFRLLADRGRSLLYSDGLSKCWAQRIKTR